MTVRAADMMRPARAFTLSTLVLACTAGVTGCGSSGGPSGPPDLTPFIGTWNVAAAELNITCSDDGAQAIQITQPTTFVMGSADSDLIDTDATCPVLYDVTGRIARALPGQSCSDPQVITKMYLDEATSTVDATGMATHQASGKLQGFINIMLGE